MDFDPRGSALVFDHLADQAEAGLLAHLGGCLEILGRNRVLGDHGLDDPRPVPDLQEVELALAPLVIEPSLEQNLFSDVLLEVADRDGPMALENLFAHVDRCKEVYGKVV